MASSFWFDDVDVIRNQIAAQPNSTFRVSQPPAIVPPGYPIVPDPKSLAGAFRRSTCIAPVMRKTRRSIRSTGTSPFARCSMRTPTKPTPSRS